MSFFAIALTLVFFCSVPQVQAGEVNQTSEVNENTIAKPTDCQSCMLLLIKLANQYQNKTESKGNVDAGQFISSALEKECYKFKFASPVVSCFAILQEINLKTIANQNSIANPTDLDAKFAICSNAVHGCPAKLNKEKLLTNATEDRNFITGGIKILTKMIGVVANLAL